MEPIVTDKVSFSIAGLGQFFANRLGTQRRLEGLHNLWDRLAKVQPDQGAIAIAPKQTALGHPQKCTRRDIATATLHGLVG